MMQEHDPNWAGRFSKLTKGLDELLRTIDIRFLVGVPVVAPMLVLGGWAFVGGRLFGGNIPREYTYMVVAACAFISSLGGFAQIVRKEAPGLLFGVPFRGILPVATGILWVALAWFACFALVYSAVVGE